MSDQASVAVIKAVRDGYLRLQRVARNHPHLAYVHNIWDSGLSLREEMYPEFQAQFADSASKRFGIIYTSKMFENYAAALNSAADALEQQDKS